MSTAEKGNWRHAVLRCVLAFTPLAGCAQDTVDVLEHGQIPGLGTVTIETHRVSGNVCGGALFASDGSATRQPPADPNRHVDYCRELIIVDPAVLASLERLSFRDVLRTITSQSTDVRTEGDLDKVFEQWTASWSDASNRTLGSAQRAVAKLLAEAWPRGHIILIAVVNRLDLEEPEGRLVFQVHKPCCDPQILAPQPMGIIVEFALPPAPAPGAGYEATKEHWAARWRRLGRADLTADAYLAELQTLVEDFVTRGSLKQIRTNEHYEEHIDWEMREYDAALNPRLLEKTPSEEIRNSDDQSWLKGLLGRADISTALREGNHRFMKEPEWTAHLGTVARFPALGDAAWELLPGLEHESLLMSFNTCNGCHRNVLNKHQGAMHLERIRAGEPARLSPFLSYKLNPPYQLPPCIQDKGARLGCAADRRENPAWNEVEYRAHNLLALDKSNKALFESSIFPNSPEPLYYRYH